MRVARTIVGNHDFKMLDQCVLFFMEVVKEYLMRPALIIVLLAVVLVYLYRSSLRQLVELHEYSEALRYPPGPFALPIVGNILLLGNLPHLNLTQLADIYGDIYSLRLGSRRVVVLNSAQVAREVLIKNAPQFSDRPPLQSFQVNSNNGQSIAFGNTGELYRYHKTFASRALSQMFQNAERFQQIASDVILNLKNTPRLNQSNEPIDPTFLAEDLVLNFTFRFVFGDDIPRSLTDELCNIVHQSSKFVENNTAVNLVDFFPWLAPLFKKQTDQVKHSVDQLMDFVKRLRSDVHLRDARQCIAGALENDVLDNDAQSPREESMAQILADLFGAGLETVTSSMTWAVAFLASNTHLQDKLYGELESAIGKSSNRSPSLADKSKMPLLQATVLEVLRMSSVLPLSLPHYCSEDSIVSGYKIDKGTVVLVNLWAINHNPNNFDQPDIFNPCRFLHPITNQLVTDDWMQALPFSTGTRKCLGATVAKSELFLLLAGLLHNFKFEMAGDSVNVKGTFGLTLRPSPFAVYARKRF